MTIKEELILGFIGTYTKKNSRGIYKFLLDLSSGKIRKLNLAYAIDNPTYLAIDRDRNILYSSCKIDDKAGVSSFKFWKEKDSLDLINQCLFEEKQPCHISVSSEKQVLISSNYHENKMIVYNTLEGIILESKNIGEHSSNNITPHIHCSVFTNDEKYIISLDLGLDKMIIYTFEDNILSKKDDLSYTFPKGTGPRQIASLTSKSIYYVLSELTSEVFVFKYDPSSNTIFENIQTINSLPNNLNIDKSGAAIKIHPNNNFLYTSDRGSNTISLFHIDQANGNLKYIDNFSCMGICPRDFQIDPSGKFLISANELSDDISIFSINQVTGNLNYIYSEKVPTPICIEFI